MFFAAKPEKARSDADKEEIAKKYKPGDQVLPKVNTRERTADERIAEEEDRRLIQEVREMSLREAEAAASSSSSSPRPRRRTNDERPTSSRDRRAESDTRRARRGTSQSRTGAESSGRTNDQLQVEESGHRRRRSDSRQRQVEHQASIRSLIGSADMSERDIEREIEEFARQIQEEGLLDGLDLDNIDLTRDDNLSRRITEAYRRRQRERSRADGERRTNNGSGRSPQPSRQRDAEQSEERLRPNDNSERSHTRTGSDSRPTSGESRTDERLNQSGTVSPNTEPPLIPTRSVRRRTMSDVRSRTMPVTASSPAIPSAARSQTDLSAMATSIDSDNQNLADERGSSVPTSPGETAPTSSQHASFASRVGQPASSNNQPSRPEATREPNVRRYRPSELTIVHSAATSPAATSPTSPIRPRTASHLYPEPSISCSRCNKPHIEYEVHYNCSSCSGGHWTLCLDCYRRGKGCLYWFGFGRGAWSKWDKLRHQRRDDSIAPPHVLIPSRYLRPPITPGGADGRKTLTTGDPKLRLEVGTFCANCLAWTNDCYWRCDVCNEGEWGFCNNCVNQGQSCTHMLLPISYDLPESQSRPAGRPSAATLQTGPQTRSLSPFRPLVFNSQCDICHNGIPAADIRYHCFACTSTLVQNASVGDYDICSSCYGELVSSGKISQENGQAGWRRCLKGHRMAVIGFADNEAGRWRYTERDVVGGRGLRIEPHGDSGSQTPQVQKWVWKQGTERWERLVSQDVSQTAPNTLAYFHGFPPDGGFGMRAHGRWAWYPQEGADDELLFPRGAEIREIEDVNGDWFFGVYMGAKGLFPSPYVATMRDT